MSPSRFVLPGALAVVGGVWVGQGVGLIGGSVMTNDPSWAVVGAVLIVVAAAIVLLGRRGATRG